jgi:hypothetical protein
MAQHKVRVQRYSTSQDLIARLSRDLQSLRQASSTALALDAAVTFAQTAWGLSAWLFRPVARDAGLRRQIARLADRGMSSLDADIFAAIMAEQCPGLELCAIIAADPTKLAVQSTGAGWLLLFLEDGEATPIGLQRLEGVAQFWQGFVRKYFADQPITRRAA